MWESTQADPTSWKPDIPCRICPRFTNPHSLPPKSSKPEFNFTKKWSPIWSVKTWKPVFVNRDMGVYIYDWSIEKTGFKLDYGACRMALWSPSKNLDSVTEGLVYRFEMDPAEVAMRLHFSETQGFLRIPLSHLCIEISEKIPCLLKQLQEFGKSKYSL